MAAMIDTLRATFCGSAARDSLNIRYDVVPIGRPESLLTEIGQRFRDVRQGLDGYLYVLTEGRVMGDDALGAVLRIEPAD